MIKLNRIYPDSNWLRIIHVLLFQLLLLLIPISFKYTSSIIVLYLFSGVVLIVKKKLKFNASSQNLLLIGFYIFLIFGVLWSFNTKMALFDLEVKLSLALFPLILSFISYSENDKKNFFLAFIVGLIVSFIVLFGNSVLLYVSEKDFDVFFYERFSNSIHPSYLSMYVVLGIVFLLYFKEIKRIIPLNYRIILISILSIFNLLLFSKIGVLAWLIVISVTAFNKMKMQYFAMFFILIMVFMNVLYISSKTIHSRVDELLIGLTNEYGVNNQGSSSIRIKVWESAIQLISEKPIFGTGTGDVKGNLIERYKENKIKKAVENKLNAHNQYLQVTIAIGIVGLIYFLILLINSFYINYHLNDMAALWFIIIFMIYSIPESVLENQAGTIFFGAFYAILNQKPPINDLIIDE